MFGNFMFSWQPDSNKEGCDLQDSYRLDMVIRYESYKCFYMLYRTEAISENFNKYWKIA